MEGREEFLGVGLVVIFKFVFLVMGRVRGNLFVRRAKKAARVKV